MKKGIIITILLAVVAFTSVGMWGDILEAGPALKKFQWYLVPVIALLGFSNDLIKFFRWHIYLQHVNIRIAMKKSFAIFISGLSMSATPGKVGFFIKSQMLKSISGQTIISSSPVIIAELYMDFIVLSVISVLGIGFLGNGVWIALILCGVPLLGLIKGVPEMAISLVSKIPLLSERTNDLRKAFDVMFSLFGTKVIVESFFITLIAWISEGIALVLILKGLGYDMGIIQATIIFGFATLIGALSLLPGGLVVTDASLMGLIVHAGIPGTPAALAAIMARIFTLWLAISIGSISLFLNRSYISGQRKEMHREQ